jgi:hypothetical protein
MQRTASPRAPRCGSGRIRCRMAGTPADIGVPMILDTRGEGNNDDFRNHAGPVALALHGPRPRRVGRTRSPLRRGHAIAVRRLGTGASTPASALIARDGTAIALAVMLTPGVELADHIGWLVRPLYVRHDRRPGRAQKPVGVMVPRCCCRAADEQHLVPRSVLVTYPVTNHNPAPAAAHARKRSEINTCRHLLARESSLRSRRSEVRSATYT